MKEATTTITPTQSKVSPLIRAKLELLYDSERVNNLLYRFMQLATTVGNSNEAIQSISSFFNTLMLRWPMKKDTILNTLLYKSANTRHLLQILWKSWSSSNEATLFQDDKNIMNNLYEATKSITGISCFMKTKSLFLAKLNFYYRF
jgi:ubiquitin-protein ligase E3 C